jgi:Putative phage tail protein
MGLMGGGKGGGKNALAAKPNLLNALRIQTSSYGQVVPIVYGQNRVSGRLLWSGDFAAIPHTSTQKVGGKGLGSGGGNAITNTTYTYQTAVAMGLCMGPIQNIHNVWDTKGRLTLVTASVPFTVPGGGGGTSIIPPGGGIFHSHKGVGRADAYNFVQDDFGSDGAITFSGTQQTPMALGPSSPATGQYVEITSASPTTISGATNASPIVITDTAHGYFTGQQVTISGVLGNTAANGAWTITVTDANHFSLNGSVGNGVYTSGGQALLVVPSFVFGSGDAGKVMTITYVYSVPDSNSNGQPQQKLNLTLFTGVRPQTPWSYLSSKHPGQDLGYNGIAYVASSAMDLGESGTLPNLSFEVLGVLPFNGGITDAEPSAIIADLITNQYYGLAGALPLGDLTQYRNFCTANGIFISPVLDAQKAASAWIQEILDITNSAAVWSEGVLKILPYGDTTAVGNGATFIPNTSPVYDLTTSDLLAEVTVKRPSIADVMNSVSVEFVNRANDYNVDVAEDKDDAMIALYGLRKDQPKQAHAITTTTVAKQVANFMRKRQVEIRATYTLTLGWQFNLLEPMDLVTLTIPELGYNKKPIRITAIRENDSGQLEMDAEDFPFGTASATLYPQQGPGGFVPQANADPGSVNPPIVFEAPSLMSRSGQHEIWMAVSGGSLGNLLLYSEQFDNTAFWSVSNATVAPNAAADPLGGQTADAITYSVAGTSSSISQNVAPSIPVGNQTFTFSCWVKMPSGTNSINLLIEDQSGAVIVNTTFAVNSSWQRFSVTGTMRSASTSITVFIYNPAAAGTFHMWGAQLENSTSMNAYNQTTSLPVRVANPNWGGCHVWISQDNSEYHQIGQIYGPSRMGALTGTATTRSNLLLNSNGFNTGSWGVDGRATLTPGNAVGPDGAGTSASTLSRNTGTLGHASDLQQIISANANASPWTFSIWARAASSTQQIQLLLGDITSTLLVSPAFTATIAWQRFSFACAAGALVNSGSMLGGITILPTSGAGSSASIQIFGAQLEKTSAMTPYIPTTSSTVTVTSLVNASADPDPTNYFPVDLTQSATALQSGTQADADSYRTLCYAGGEFISFEGAALTGSNKYNAGQDSSGNVYLRRGLFGSNITTHGPGEAFARLDGSIFTYAYDPSFIGKTLYLKFTSFNTSGLMEQSIANATAYQFILTGKYCQMETASKNLLANPGFEYNVAGTRFRHTQI